MKVNSLSIFSECIKMASSPQKKKGCPILDAKRSTPEQETPQTEPAKTKLLEKEQHFLAQLLISNDVDMIIKGKEEAEQNLKTIIGCKINPIDLIESKLGILLQKLANKCNSSSELYSLRDILKETIKKVKNDVLLQIFGEEEKDSVQSNGFNHEKKPADNGIIKDQTLMNNICREISRLLEEV